MGHLGEHFAHSMHTRTSTQHKYDVCNIVVANYAHKFGVGFPTCLKVQGTHRNVNSTLVI